MTNSAADLKATTNTREREALILGKPPRIGPLTAEEIGEKGLAEINRMRATLNLPPIDYIPEYTATMQRYPDLQRRHTELAMLFFNGTLPLRDRELAILRNAWLAQAPFEWGEHVQLGKRLAGLTTEDVERVTQGSGAPGWSEHDRAVLRAVEELHENAMISDETWATLQRTWNDKQLIEFPLMIGQYIGVAFMQNSLRMRLFGDNPGLSAR
jgi:alkylhydroperoxidase family enzyme